MKPSHSSLDFVQGGVPSQRLLHGDAWLVDSDVIKLQWLTLEDFSCRGVVAILRSKVPSWLGGTKSA